METNEKVKGIDKLLTSRDICQLLDINRSRFDFYKPGLLAAGMFQLNGRRSQYRMTKDDFVKFIETIKSN